MALKQCKDCGNTVSRSAKACPQCGAPVKARFSIGRVFLGVILTFVILGALATWKDSTVGYKSSDEKAYKMRESVSVGYMSYVIRRAWWSEILTDNLYAKNRPNVTYLFISLTARNDDKKARMIPLLYLVDEDGRKFDINTDVMWGENYIGLLDSLNPGVSQHGILVFEVPSGHDYQLRLSGGYWSPEKAFVQIEPEN